MLFDNVGEGISDGFVALKQNQGCFVSEKISQIIVV